MPSFEQRDSGLWSVRFTTYEGEKEKTKRLSGFKTKREAREAYEKYKAENITRSKRKPTPADNFRDLLALYLEHQKTALKESSFEDYRLRIGKHIAPFFGDGPTLDITPAKILEWQHTLDGYSYKYKITLRGLLISIFRFGHKYYDLPNPMDKVDGFRNLDGKKEMSIWTEEEFARFLSCADDPLYHAFFRFLYATGCRRGEALALTRGDIDVGKRVVSITKSVSFRTKDGFKVTSPKNAASNRRIVVSQSVLDEILSLPDGKFIFGGEKPVTEATIRRRLSNYAKRAGLNEIRLHDLRHSHASLLISKGVSIVAVSKRLGHATTEQTLNTYAHMMPSDVDRIDQAISSI